MPEHQQRLAFLLHRYAAKTASPEEENELFRLLGETDEPAIESLLAGILEQTEPEPDENRRQRLLQKLAEANAMTPPARIFTLRRVFAAASILLFLGVGAWLLLVNKKQPVSQVTKAAPVKDIAAPIATKATITLAGGQTVPLDSIANGLLAKQGTITLVKAADGKISYNGHSNEIIFNTLFNPRGSKVVSLALNDGTLVWLNSESTIKYPVAFADNERRVEITGEAYFEVTKDAKRKFIVTANGTATEVLGTYFNVNAYNDENSTDITLLEGAVKITKGTATCLLNPGQQARVAGGVKIVSGVDTETVMAWKNGLFSFKAAGIKEVMRQVARWYDVDVVYEKEIKETFFVKLGRNTNVSNVLRILERTGGVHFTVEGRKIIVKP